MHVPESSPPEAVGGRHRLIEPMIEPPTAPVPQIAPDVQPPTFAAILRQVLGGLVPVLKSQDSRRPGGRHRADRGSSRGA